MYIKPHTYDLTFERLPKNVNILESWCDAKEWIEWNKTQQAPAGRGGAPTAPTGRGRGGLVSPTPTPGANHFVRVSGESR